MKVILTKSGGFTGVKMSAESDWDINNNEWDELIAAIEKPASRGEATKKRDSFHHSLQKEDGSSIPVNISKVPEKFSHLFKPMFDKMKAGQFKK